MNTYSVYILASKKNGTLYIERTQNLAKRIYDHRNGIVDGFTKKYNVKTLVYVENFDHPLDAAKREKALKKWKREWKIKLIETNNQQWNDLYFRLNQ
jgi:putative endonuclease